MRDFFVTDAALEPFVIEVDASPWGGGAALWHRHGHTAASPPLAYIWVRWDTVDEGVTGG